MHATSPLAQFLTDYGYWAVALGCLLEGETLLVLAGFAARRGYLSLPLVMALGAGMGALADMFFFWLGRRHGTRVLARWPRIGRYRERLDRGLARYGSWIVVGVRFMYGLRIAGPVLLGTTSLPWPRFVLFNLLGAVLWAVLVAGAGWLFGHAAEMALEHIRPIEEALFAALLLGMLGWGGWRYWRSRQSRMD